MAHLTLRRDVADFTEVRSIKDTDWPENANLTIRPDLIYYSVQQPTLQPPQTQYALFDPSRHPALAQLVAESGEFSFIGRADQIELWRRN